MANFDLNDFLLETKYSNETKRVTIWLFNKIKKNNYNIQDLLTFKTNDFEMLLIQLNPKCLSDIHQYQSIIQSYINWCVKKGFAKDIIIDEFDAVNKKAIWERHKDNARKFISYNQYLEIIDDIDKSEELNSLYYSTLFKCLYEGIYDKNWKTVKNLKLSDLSEHKVSINDNNQNWELDISEDLTERLIELSGIDKWERKHRYGISQVNLIGEDFKNCFKIEVRNRDNMNESAYYFYQRKFELIVKKYIGYKTLPLHIYISGIMHRIKENLNLAGISLEEAFRSGNKNKIVYKIISDELSRVHYEIPVAKFKNHIHSHLNVFLED